jgi:GntR family transcriptional regulator, transcriptional repressor for pyruvate dehydrogenase complex
VALTDAAIDKIKEMITSGRLRPGEKLPREADLAAELGLSRNSLREAVKALSLINVLDVRQGDGTYATSLAPSLLLEALSFMVDFHRDDTVLEFLEVRRILEPAATELAALRMPDEGRKELGEILQSADVNSPIEDFVAADLEFHRKIALGAGNSVLASLVDNMSVPTRRARLWRGVTEPQARERTLAEHAAIYHAIMSRDAGLARSSAIVHIAGIESWLRTALAD